MYLFNSVWYVKFVEKATSIFSLKPEILQENAANQIRLCTVILESQLKYLQIIQSLIINAEKTAKN